MADGPSAEDAAATELPEGADIRVPRERHKRQDAKHLPEEVSRVPQELLRLVMDTARTRKSEQNPNKDPSAKPTASGQHAANVVHADEQSVMNDESPSVSQDTMEMEDKVENSSTSSSEDIGAGADSTRHQGSSYKGRVRVAEDTLVGPCGKKRCADRYDSSESSDSGVAVSCGECSSSGTSDITEPGSPCSTSSDEGVAVRAVTGSPLPPCCPAAKPATVTSQSTAQRLQWPWTPPLAATACSTYKRLKVEPEAGTLARSVATDPAPRKPPTRNANNYHHETQGKITEYFKTQIKPQQAKGKKTNVENSTAMSVLVAKNSPEFRRPPTVQRNKGGLAKYLGASTTPAITSDWEVRALTMSPPPVKNTLQPMVPRPNGKLDKKMPKSLPSLPDQLLKSHLLQSSKISNLRLTPDKVSQVDSAEAPSPVQESVGLELKSCILAKPHVNENNNLTSLISLRSLGQSALCRVSPPRTLEIEEKKKEPVSPVSAVDDEEPEEEEDDSSSSKVEATPSPILSAPTTIRFPAQVPRKNRADSADSGLCRWDKCEASFECGSSLLEHLQMAHINTQTGGDNFVCQWQGCKVQGRTSCSRRWLERHVLSHGGNKPFRCIVDGCGSRFSSQTALERHVNGHFNQPETTSSNGRRSCESGGKLVRRNGKKLRYRRQPWSARIFDYFDNGVMEGLQHRLLKLEQLRTQGRLADTPGDAMVLTSQVLARRAEIDGKVRVLIRWYPEDIEPDEWMLESDVQETKTVPIRKASVNSGGAVCLALYPAINGGSPPLNRVKQRRKPLKIT
ncbi:uncharacterized protein jing [Prorops nasuta]|uniref:uncharacterized protein jing n=1 Tax=Prorops nasuta TaxID=863751 RepID=UPI0034CDF258